MSARKPIVLVALLVATVLPTAGVRAQTPFAATNIGQRISPDDARMVGRGGWGMAVADTTHPGFKNLASLAYLRHVALRYTGYGELADSRTGDRSRRTAEAYSPGIQFALPVIKNRLGVTAGFNMYRSTRWDTAEDVTWTLPDTTVDGGIAVTRQGTRFNVPLGVAWRVGGGLSISGAVNLESGSILEQYTEAFGSASALPNSKETKDLFTGTSYTLSALWVPFDRLHVGASWTPGYDLRVDRTVKLEGVTARARTSWDMALPDEYRAGMQLRFTNRWQVGADIQYMAMTDFAGYPLWEADMEDEYTLGVGLERRKANERRAGMRNLPLRLGANLHRWGYRLGGEPIDELTFSVGTGFALAHDLGQLDVSFSYGMIGDLEKNGAESTVYRLGLSITGLEAWW